VREEQLYSGHLFYTLGNSWFMAGDTGRAILNYRRAQRYLPHDDDVEHNLAFALKQRADLIPAKEPHPLVARLLGWHINTPAALRGWLFALCWLIFWGGWIRLRRQPKKETRIVTGSAGLLCAVLLASLLTETLLRQRAEPGVIIAPEVLARKGDGEMYAPAFLDPLHSGTEFVRLEDRSRWWLIQLDDGQTCWIPSRAAELVSL
jgi:hypothetical protein